MPAAIPIVAAGIGAAGSIIGSHQQSQGAKGAANLANEQFRTTNAQEQPFIQSGYGATSRLNQLLGIGSDSGSGDYGSLTKGFSPQDFLANKDPGYDFELQQGQQALQNSAAGQSGALSGAAVKDLLGYSQGFARTGYDNAFNRYQTQQGNIFSRLSGIAQLGQSAAANVGNQGTSLANTGANALTNSGSATGGGIVGAGNALGGGIQNMWLGSLLGTGGGGGATSGFNYTGNTPADLAGYP